MLLAREFLCKAGAELHLAHSESYCSCHIHGARTDLRCRVCSYSRPNSGRARFKFGPGDSPSCVMILVGFQAQDAW